MIVKAMLVIGTSLSFVLWPSFASAQSFDFTNLEGILDSIASLIDIIYGVLVAIAVLVVAYGIFKFIVNADDEEGRRTGRQAMFWGIIGIFVMTSIWGFVHILVNTFDFDTSPSGAVPTTIVPPLY